MQLQIGTQFSQFQKVTWKESDSEYSFDSKKKEQTATNNNKQQVATSNNKQQQPPKPLGISTWCFQAHHAAASVYFDPCIRADEKVPMDVGETQSTGVNNGTENSEDISMKIFFMKVKILERLRDLS